MSITSLLHTGAACIRRCCLGLSLGLVGLLVATDQADADLQAGFVNTRTEMQVEAVSVRGPYLEIQLDTKGDLFFVYLEASPTCRQLASGTALAYVDNGPLGVVEVGDARCQVYGVGNLRLWRDRRSSSTRDSSRTVPRSQARYQTLYRDAEVALLRGSFPQAARLGFSGHQDLIAVVPIEPVCQKPIESGVGSIEFRPRGSEALSLVGANGLCTILGLVNPLPESQPSAAKKAETKAASE
jgi:hypothetical protein